MNGGNDTRCLLSIGVELLVNEIDVKLEDLIGPERR